jgi:hypothetical protein
MNVVTGLRRITGIGEEPFAWLMHQETIPAKKSEQSE